MTYSCPDRLAEMEIGGVGVPVFAVTSHSGEQDVGRLDVEVNDAVLVRDLLRKDSVLLPTTTRNGLAVSQVSPRDGCGRHIHWPRPDDCHRSMVRAIESACMLLGISDYTMSATVCYNPCGYR